MYSPYDRCVTTSIAFYIDVEAEGGTRGRVPPHVESRRAQDQGTLHADCVYT